MTTSEIQKLREEFEANPGGGFAALAAALMDSAEGRKEAREACFRGLAANPQHKLGRLLLARAYYLDNLFEFSVRELVELRHLSAASGGVTPGVEKLLEEFGPLATQYLQRGGPEKAAPAAAVTKEDDGVVAEIDIDSDFIDAIEEQKEGE